MTMTISIELGAATGIVGTVALLLFLWLNEKNIGLFLSGKIFFVALMASLLFAVFVEVILSNSVDRKSTRLNSSHITRSRMPSSA